MAKVTLFTLANLDNPNTAVSQINTNFTRLSAQIDLLLSRDGESPNTVLSNLDMNGYRILNLPAPTTAQEPARHGDIQQYVDQAEGFAEDAEQSAIEADEARDETVLLYDDFQGSYGGMLASDPLVDANGDPLVSGYFYFNTTLNTFRFFAIWNVLVVADEVVAGSDNVIMSEWTNLPSPTYAGLSDVDVTGIGNNYIMRWNAGQEQWLPYALTAGITIFDPAGTMFTGTNVQDALEEVSTRTSLGSYDIILYAQGLMDNNESLFRMYASRDFSLPISLTGSQCHCRVAPNAPTALALKKNGADIGSVNFTTTTGTFTFTAEVSFTEGDLLSLHAPASADTAIQDVSITLKADR